MWCICTIWRYSPESQSVTMPYNHQNYWMHVFFEGVFSDHMEHFGLWNVKIVVSVVESNLLCGSSEALRTNLAKIKDFCHFSHLSVLSFLSLFLHFTEKKCLKEIKFKFSFQYCDSETTFFLSFYVLFFFLMLNGRCLSALWPYERCKM